MTRRALVVVGLVAAALAALPAIAALHDPVISSNEPLPFPRNGQNEPALALDRAVKRRGPLLFAGGNDYRDQGACKGASHCGFEDTIGISGVYYSDQGSGWIRSKVARPAGVVAGPTAITTLPNFSNGMWSFGDPALVAGPWPLGDPHAWASGTRFYYATLTAEPGSGRVITVSSADARKPARLGLPTWLPPTQVSTGKRPADKPAIWADGVARSPNFGHVYACWTEFTGDEDAGGQILFSQSLDGGVTWAAPLPISASKPQQAQGCAIRSDASGTIYVFWRERTPRPLDIKSASGTPCSKLFKSAIFSAQSSDGATFTTRPVTTVLEPGRWDRTQLQCTVDGITGARVNSFPSVDIANGGPSGNGNNVIALATSEGQSGGVVIRTSHDHGNTWSSRLTASAPAAGAAFPAVALAPSGRRLFLVYTAFLQPWRKLPTQSRPLRAVVRTVPLKILEARSTSGWAEVDGSVGDARSSANFEGGDAGRDPLQAEFLGDYDAIVATEAGAWAAWTDVSAAAVCTAVNTYRTEVVTGKDRRFPVFAANACPPQRRPGGVLVKTFGNTTLCGVYIPADVQTGTQETQCASDVHR